MAESFFHTLKTELTHHQQFQTKAEANQAIFEYIEVFYNRQKIHSANDNLSFCLRIIFGYVLELTYH